MWRPRSWSRLLWAAQIQDLERRKKVLRMSFPCSWVRLMTLESLEGSRRNLVKVWGLACRAARTGGRRWGRGERHLFQY